MVYIPKQQILTRFRRYKALNETRLERSLSLMNHDTRFCLAIVPVLLHYNHINLPGYREGYIPHGIDLFTLNDVQRRYLDDTLLPGSPPLEEPKEHAILGLYAMGSTSSLGQTKKSDVDIWVCVKASLSEAGTKALQDKCRFITDFVKAHNVELNLFVTPEDRFTNFQPDSLDEENCGSAQNLFLLDEFYRSSIRLCGRYILWYLISTSEEEQSYQAYADFLTKGISGMKAFEAGRPLMGNHYAKHATDSPLAKTAIAIASTASYCAPFVSVCPVLANQSQFVTPSAFDVRPFARKKLNVSKASIKTRLSQEDDVDVNNDKHVSAAKLFRDLAAIDVERLNGDLSESNIPSQEREGHSASHNGLGFGGASDVPSADDALGYALDVVIGSINLTARACFDYPSGSQMRQAHPHVIRTVAKINFEAVGESDSKVKSRRKDKYASLMSEVPDATHNLAKGQSSKGLRRAVSKLASYYQSRISSVSNHHVKNANLIAASQSSAKLAYATNHDGKKHLDKSTVIYSDKSSELHLGCQDQESSYLVRDGAGMDSVSPYDGLSTYTGADAGSFNATAKMNVLMSLNGSDTQGELSTSIKLNQIDAGDFPDYAQGAFCSIDLHANSVKSDSDSMHFSAQVSILGSADKAPDRNTIETKDTAFSLRHNKLEASAELEGYSSRLGRNKISYDGRVHETDFAALTDTDYHGTDIINGSDESLVERALQFKGAQFEPKLTSLANKSYGHTGEELCSISAAAADKEVGSARVDGAASRTCGAADASTGTRGDSDGVTTAKDQGLGDGALVTQTKDQGLGDGALKAECGGDDGVSVADDDGLVWDHAAKSRQNLINNSIADAVNSSFISRDEFLSQGLVRNVGSALASDSSPNACSALGADLVRNVGSGLAADLSKRVDLSGEAKSSSLVPLDSTYGLSISGRLIQGTSVLDGSEDDTSLEFAQASVALTDAHDHFLGHGSALSKSQEQELAWYLEQDASSVDKQDLADAIRELDAAGSEYRFKNGDDKQAALARAEAVKARAKAIRKKRAARRNEAVARAGALLVKRMSGANAINNLFQKLFPNLQTENELKNVLTDLEHNNPDSYTQISAKIIELENNAASTNRALSQSRDEAVYGYPGLDAAIERDSKNHAALTLERKLNHPKAGSVENQFDEKQTDLNSFKRLHDKSIGNSVAANTSHSHLYDDNEGTKVGVSAAVVERKLPLGKHEDFVSGPLSASIPVKQVVQYSNGKTRSSVFTEPSIARKRVIDKAKDVAAKRAGYEVSKDDDRRYKTKASGLERLAAAMGVMPTPFLDGNIHNMYLNAFTHEDDNVPLDTNFDGHKDTAWSQPKMQQNRAPAASSAIAHRQHPSNYKLFAAKSLDQEGLGSYALMAGYGASALLSVHRNNGAYSAANGVRTPGFSSKSADFSHSDGLIGTVNNAIGGSMSAAVHDAAKGSVAEAVSGRVVHGAAKGDVAEAISGRVVHDATRLGGSRVLARSGNTGSKVSYNVANAQGIGAYAVNLGTMNGHSVIEQSSASLVQTGLQTGGTKASYPFRSYGNVLSEDESIKAAAVDGFVEYEAPLNPDEWFDFGSVVFSSPTEYFGSGLWLLYKAIESPLKVVLKILLMEAYSSDYPSTKLLSSELKDYMLSHDGYSIDLDSYYLMYRRVSDYLIASGSDSRLSLMRKCFYLKIFDGLGTSNYSHRDDSALKRELLNKFARRWGWDHDFIFKLEQFSSWKLGSVRAFNREVYNTLLESYLALLRFSIRHGIEYAITSDDAAILSRKLYAAFDRYPGKIAVMNTSFSKNLEEMHLTFITPSQDSLCRRGWHMYRAAADDVALLNLKPAYIGSRLPEVVAWACFNGLMTSRTTAHLAGAPSVVSPMMIKQLSFDIMRVIGSKRGRVSERSLQRPSKLMGCLVVLNLEDDETELYKNQILDTDYGSTLSLGRQRVCLVGSIDLVMINSWGEIRSITLPSGEDGVVELLATLLRILRNSTEVGQEGESVAAMLETIEVCSYAIAYQDLIKYDLESVLRQVFNCLSGDSSSEYTFDVGRNTYVAKAQGERGVIINKKNSFGAGEYDISVLSRYGMRPEFALQVPPVIDRYATAGIMQYFFIPTVHDSGHWDIYIINERNEVAIENDYVGSRATLVNAINRFYTEQSRGLSINSARFNLPQYFVLSKDLKSIHPFTIRNNAD